MEVIFWVKDRPLHDRLCILGDVGNILFTTQKQCELPKTHKIYIHAKCLLP